MKTHILAIDQGTTSTRAIVFTRDGAMAGMAQTELKLSYPHNGWVEQDAEAIWRDTQTVARDALERSGLKAADIAAIGITNQRETTIVWDKNTGKPVYNAIVWQDRRTADICAGLKKEGLEQEIAEKTGLLLDPYFSATKLQWILDNVAGARAAADRGDLLFGTVDCYLLWKLTSGKSHATDIANASRTMLFNIMSQEWDDALLARFNVPKSMLPVVMDNSADYGVTDILGGPVPITGMAGDQQAALIGQACFKTGMVKSTYGTGCFILMNIGETPRLSKNKLLTTVAYRLQGRICYALEGSIFVSGAAIQWLRDGLGIIANSTESAALASALPDNGGVYLVPAFTGLGAPYWEPEARGLICGLSRATTRAHLARAALEAQGYQTQDLMQAMVDDSGVPFTEFRVDGGMVKNDWMCQFIADMAERPVLRPACVETTALGAAYLAGLQAGLYSGLEDVEQTWQLQKEFSPGMADTERKGLYAGWQAAVRKTLAP